MLALGNPPTSLSTGLDTQWQSIQVLQGVAVLLCLLSLLLSFAPSGLPCFSHSPISGLIPLAGVLFSQLLLRCQFARFALYSKFCSDITLITTAALALLITSTPLALPRPYHSVICVTSVRTARGLLVVPGLSAFQINAWHKVNSRFMEWRLKKI